MRYVGPRFHTFASLKAHLETARPSGPAPLYRYDAPGDEAWVIGWWRWNASTSAVQLASTLYLERADGREFVIDATEGHIRPLGGIDPPTWGTPGAATGGLILDADGYVEHHHMLPILGAYPDNIVIDALWHTLEDGAGNGSLIGCGVGKSGSTSKRCMSLLYRDATNGWQVAAQGGTTVFTSPAMARSAPGDGWVITELVCGNNGGASSSFNLHNTSYGENAGRGGWRTSNAGAQSTFSIDGTDPWVDTILLRRVGFASRLRQLRIIGVEMG